MKKEESGVGAKSSTSDEDQWQVAVQEFALIMEEAFDVEKSLKLEPAEIEGALCNSFHKAPSIRTVAMGQPLSKAVW